MVTIVQPDVGPAVGITPSKTGACDRISSAQDPSVSTPLFDTPTWAVSGNDTPGCSANDEDEEMEASPSTRTDVVQATSSVDMNRASVVHDTRVRPVLTEASRGCSDATRSNRKTHDISFEGEKPLPDTTISDSHAGGTLSGYTPGKGKLHITQRSVVGRWICIS